jgi:hypothetical protein
MCDVGGEDAGSYPMATRPIANSVFPVRCTGLFGSALLAAVVATALLSAGEARAALSSGDGAFCANQGGLSGGGYCLPDLDILSSGFTWHKRSRPSSDVWFAISFDPSSINLIFTEEAAGHFDARNGGHFDAENKSVLELSGIEPDPDELMFITSVEFIGTWASLPTLAPTEFNDGLPGNMAGILWDLANANPSGGDVAKIHLSFAPELSVVPEPGTAALLGLGLAGLGVVGRSKREESERTA